MSPDMLTLVAAVLAYDIALESCDPRSVRLLPPSLKVRSETREEKDMMGVNFMDRIEECEVRCECICIRVSQTRRMRFNSVLTISTW